MATDHPAAERSAGARPLSSRPAAALAVACAAGMLLWPALWNGYPIVFADSGTYLSQAVHHYAGWDRPVFYSLFMLPLHATLTVWPVVVAQSVIACWILWLVCRVLFRRPSPLLLICAAAPLAGATCLPWLVSELMPDLFTPLLILVIGLLAWVPDRLSRREQIILAAMATWMIASQQSSLPLACILFPMLAILARLRPPASPWHQPSSPSRPDSASPGRRDRDRAPTRPAHRTHAAAERSAGSQAAPVGAVRRCLLVTLPPVLAIVGLCAMNLAAHGRFAISPFGNVFFLARVIYDGPGMEILRRDCPAQHWRLCPFIDRFPPTSDDFLWNADSPLNPAGGPKAVSRDAGAIITAALLAYPLTELRAAMANSLEQLGRFDSGDGLQAWPAQVTPWIERDFPPREAMAYANARQQAGVLSVPPPLPALHIQVALIGLAACVVLAPLAFIRRAPSAGFLLAVLISIPLGAAITGSLSAPHDRYQSRIMWLPPFVAALSVAALLAGETSQAAPRAPPWPPSRPVIRPD